MRPSSSSVVLSALIVVSFGILPVPMCNVEADSSLLPHLHLTLLPHLVGVNVTGTDPATATFEGTYEVDQPPGVTSQLTITYGMDPNWMVVIDPDAVSCTGPTSGTFNVVVTVPAGTAPGRTSILTLGTLKPPIIEAVEAIAGANIEHELKGTWTFTIIEPAYGASIAEEVITVRGTATFSSDEIDRVEVRGGTGIWTKAEGTAQWSVDLDLSHLTNGVHRIEARAISKKGIEENAHVSITLELPSDTQMGDIGDLPDKPNEGEEWWRNRNLSIAIIMVGSIVGVLVAYRYLKGKKAPKEYY